MDAERALADLLDVSPQVEVALVFEAGGSVVGSVGVPEGREPLLAGAAGELVQGASESGVVTQLRASLDGSEVFVVGGASGERGIVAVTSGRTAPGLVFYDLKRCLAALAGGEQEPDGEADDAA